jgi:hypothetical protein
MIERFLAEHPKAWAGYPTTAILSVMDIENMRAREARLRRGGYDGPRLDVGDHRRIEAWIASERLRKRQRYQADVNAVMSWT